MRPGSPEAVALVLGAALRPDGAPSAAMRRRVATAAALWHEGAVGRILASGGAVRHPRPEAEVMREMLIAAGVPAGAILCEGRSRNTAENIRNARALLPPGAPVVIVTDRYHLPRALMIARAEGLAATGAAAPPGSGAAWWMAWAREGPATLKWLLLRR